METDQDVLDFIARNPPYWGYTAETITYSETISRPIKIRFWRAYLSRRAYPKIPEGVRNTIEGLRLVFEANAPADVMEKAIASEIKHKTIWPNQNNHEFIDLAFELRLNMHNIMKKCEDFETFQYALAQGFIPQHYNYLKNYLTFSSRPKLKMVEFLFSISPKDTLFSTPIHNLINFFRKKEDKTIFLECLEVLLNAQVNLPVQDLISLDIDPINQLLIDYRYPFTKSDYDSTVRILFKKPPRSSYLLAYMCEIIPDIHPRLRKTLVYTKYSAGGNMKFSFADFTTYASPKIKETFKSFFGGAVVIGLLPREVEEMIMKQYFEFNV